jgi:PadR family transcriptional regulator, regulatory protein PadR
MSQIQQLRKGSTPLLILNVLSDGKKYGYQIMRELEERSEGYFSMTAALLYPALHELEQNGLVESEWEAGEGKRRRKFYTITDAGRKALAEHRADWQTFIAHLLKTLQEPDDRQPDGRLEGRV